jgi:UDP-N-acetylmuramoyl-L-alanyl-D-glutamate--2,6-diaminopimelate ligase
MLSLLKRIPGARFLSELPFLSKPYHFSLAFIGALFCGFPSRRLVVIGVTGTKGKTTTANLIADILSAAGYKTGLLTTLNYRIGDKEWVNDTKQTMPGRFALQKLLRQMVREGCSYAVVETSSEGILQYRHKFINYRVAVFTNLSPEHIERHGSFEKYREAKLKLFREVAKRDDGIGIYNLDDPNAEHFLKPEIKIKYGYFYKNPNDKIQITKKFQISDVKLSQTGTGFRLNGWEFKMPLLGEFNVMNAAAAVCAALSLGVPPERIRAALQNARALPGRAEIVEGGGFKVIVDYAHEPASLRAIYETAKLFKPRRLVGVLGSQGGGRDVWKRAAMGRIAAGCCDELILTNEDPYDEDPVNIISDIEKGVRDAAKPGLKLHKIIDRREAIFKAVSLAGKGDAVVVTGKGGEVWMCVAGGRKIPWSDKKIVEEALGK